MKGESRLYIKFKQDEKNIEFKDGDERNELSDDLSMFNDAGYVLTDHDLVVDIDNISQEKVKVLIETFGIETETVWSNSGEQNGHNGVHLYFRKPDGFKQKKAITPLGFEVEYKHKPSSKYITVKRHGVAREVEHRGVRQELPAIFEPRPKGSYKDMYSMDEGDGRNDAMFAHKVQIMTIPSWRKILRFINEHIFNEPLPDSEMELLSRDQDLIATKDNAYEMATALIHDYNIVKYNQTLYYRQGGVYRSDSDMLERLVWSRCKGMSSAYVRELINQIGGRSKLIDSDTVFPIKFENGILRNGEFIFMDYEDFTPYTIDIPYIPDIEPVEAVDKYLDHLTGGDPDYRLFIGEVLGHTLIKDRYLKNSVPHIFFFIGGGGNGKGTLLRIIERIVNVENTSQLDIQQLIDEKYLITINNKLVNLGDDVEDKAIGTHAMKLLKNIASADTIQMRKLYEVSETVTPTATLIFTSNHIIKSFEKGDSVKRRFRWCPMYTKVDKIDPNFIPSITNSDALKYWVRLMVEGYMRIYTNGCMTDNEPVNNETARYHQENNLSEMFVDDLTLDDVLYIKPKEVFDRYVLWCEDEGIEPTSARIFNSNIQDRFNVIRGVKKIQGKSHRVYLSNVETDQEEE